MTRYAEIEKALREVQAFAYLSPRLAEIVMAALALPEDSKIVNAELYDLAIALADSAARSDIETMCVMTWPKGNKLEAVCDEDAADVARALRYLELREASGDPLPYKIIREGNKVRFQ